jgi:solute carrier family 13 (sodium-dependent dicarboxylate transporter), member 2/3/5
MFLILTPAIKQVSVVFAILFVSDMYYSLILLSNDASMAALNHWPPLPFLAGITLSSSLAFLLPMGTPPNALVYEQGKIQIKEMIKNGIVLTIIAIILISVFTIFLYPLLLPEIS